MRNSRSMVAFFVLLSIFSLTAAHLQAAPTDSDMVRKAAESFFLLRYAEPDRQAGQTAGNTTSDVVRQVSETEPFYDGDGIVGYIVHFQPNGYVLMRADDSCPPVKLYDKTGFFWDLHPRFLCAMREELRSELGCLKNTGDDAMLASTTRFTLQWLSLLDVKADDHTLDSFRGEGVKAGPILTTTWNQNSPYNYYSPTATGGPGGRAWAGCVATAMSQVMRYHQHPVVISQNRTYSDNWGSCTGSHSCSEAGLGPYAWANMPTSINVNSPLVQKQAVAQLIHHAGVTVSMDFEATGSGAYSSDVPGALRTYFGYTCNNLTWRFLYSNATWYSKLNTDIVAGQPVYYAFQSAEGGHAIVCDGTRNGNEIHLNFGWSGSCNNWYNMDSVVCNGTWTSHEAIFAIKPACTVPGAPVGLSATATGVSQVTLNWSTGSPSGTAYNIYRAAGNCPATGFSRIYTGVTGTNYTDTSMNKSSFFSYYVTATNPAGTSGSCESSPSNCAAVAIIVPALAAPAMVLLMALLGYLIYCRKGTAVLKRHKK